jgi:D-glycero-D-manno-heptose 1,7-bisphosphate phosphatase
MRVTVGPRGAVFLDRDGTINVKLDDDYVTRPGELILLDGAAEAVAEINRAGRKAIVITNQRGIALGRMTEGDLAVVHASMERLVGEIAGASFTGIVHCPHGRDECDCRKPKPGLLVNAARDRGIDLPSSFMVGDRWRDIDAGLAAGCRAIFIDRGYNERKPERFAVNVAGLPEAAAWILEQTP